MASKVGARNEALTRWLASIGAEMIGPELGGMDYGLDGKVALFRTPRGRMFMVVIYDRGGWDVFTGFPGIGINDTLADARVRLGLGS